MTSKPERIAVWTFVNLPVAGLLALAITTSGLAQDEPASKADDGPRFEAQAAPAIASDPWWKEEPMISYEVGLLEVDDLIGLDFDFEVGDEEEPVLIGFLSENERRLLIGSVFLSPSGWMLKAPKVTSIEGARANFRFPREPGLDLDGVAPSTSVKVSGTIKKTKDREYIQLSVLMEEEERGAGRFDREEAEGREARVTIPNGGTVILNIDHPAEVEARGRQRLILVTPRRILTEEEEQQLIQQPGVLRQPLLRNPLKD